MRGWPRTIAILAVLGIVLWGGGSFFGVWGFARRHAKVPSALPPSDGAAGCVEVAAWNAAGGLRRALVSGSRKALYLAFPKII